VFKKILIVFVLLVAAVCGAGYFGYKSLVATLPRLITIEDYKPLLVTKVFDRNGKKIGEFFRERRVLIPYKEIPKDVVNAFLAAEDDQFFKHGGINYVAIMRATIANMRAGTTVQGGSTITQQVAKTLMLSSERTILRKVKEALLAQQMEEHLSKEDILYLYLNQIYFGNGAYGIGMAAETYYRKTVKQMSLAEIAILASLPKAPSAFSPTRNPERAKERQLYVLRRMVEVGFTEKAVADKAGQEIIKVYSRENFENRGPFYLETVRQMLVNKLGEQAVLDEGLRITTSMDLKAQVAAQNAMSSNLKELDKRQGFRGALKNTVDPKEVGEFLLKTRNKLIVEAVPERSILPDGKFFDYGPLNLKYDLKKGLPFYIKIGQTAEGIISKVDDELGIVHVRMAELEGLIDFETMKWARKPDAEKRFDLDQIKKPSQALKMGDIVLLKLTDLKFPQPARLAKITKANKNLKIPDWNRYVSFELDQEPIAEGALISFDLQSGDVLSMVGGNNFEKSEYNRAIQAARQSGSSFKTFVYLAAFDKGYTPASPLIDAPLVYEEGKTSDGDEGQGDTKIWKPENHGKSFGGDIIMRNAFVKSLNVPSVKIIEDIGVPWSIEYARRLGIFSPLNPDFTLVLGSSSVTLFEITKAFGHIAKLGKKLNPILIRKVQNSKGQELLGAVSLDERFSKELGELEKQFEEKRTSYVEAKAQNQEFDPKKKTEPHFFFDDPEQLIAPTTAYLQTSLLKGVVEDRQGTGGRAKALGREVVGKTGSTNGYFDAWFVGYTAQVATGVWAGFDHEKSLGKGEVGGRAALPAWVDYMKAVHEDLPQLPLAVPNGIVFANIDADTGQLASANSKNLIRQAFLEGTEPTANRNKKEEESDFLKQDLSE
jgi:penicillin-binding protein 1A